MRVAVAGKGGAGKTTLAATMARLLARDGRRVVAIDADSNPNLGPALGVPAAAEPGFLPADIVSRRLHGPALAASLDTILDTHAAAGPDGTRLARMGMPTHAEEGCMCAAHATVSALLTALGDHDDRVAIVDLEASPEHLSRGTARHVDLLLVVAEPYYRALEAARRIAVLAAELPIPRVAVVANKVRAATDAAAVADFCARHGLVLAGEVPWSDAALDADAAGVPLLDRAPEDAAVGAMRSLAGRLVVPAVTADRPARR